MLRIRLPRRGRYVGRLAFDPDSGFHLDRRGRRVVTPDGGKTWRYARRSDPSHISRYQLRTALVDTTANAVAGLTVEEARMAHPHHFEAQPGDAHYDADAPHKTRLLHDPAAAAARVTSHTEAYRD